MSYLLSMLSAPVLFFALVAGILLATRLVSGLVSLGRRLSPGRRVASSLDTVDSYKVGMLSYAAGFNLPVIYALTIYLDGESLGERVYRGFVFSSSGRYIFQSEVSSDLPVPLQWPIDLEYDSMMFDTPLYSSVRNYLYVSHSWFRYSDEVL